MNVLDIRMAASIMKRGWRYRSSFATLVRVAGETFTKGVQVATEFELSIHGIRMTLRPQDWLGFPEVIIDGEYDPVIKLLGRVASPIVVDLGANVGFFGARCLTLFPRSRVFSVEPDPLTFELLKRNAARNFPETWSVGNFAVGGRPKRALIVSRGFSTGAKVVDDAVEKDGFASVSAVSVRTLADLLDSEQIGHIDLLKVDIEGYEQEVLVNSVELLDRVNSLVVEIHEPQSSFRECTDLLRNHFPNVRKIEGRSSSKPLVLASRLDE